MAVLETMETLFPKPKNDITLRQLLKKVPSLGPTPEPSHIAQLFIDLEEVFSKMSHGAMGPQKNSFS